MPTGKKLESRILDEKDKKILMMLQDDGRVLLKKIANEVGLSIDSVHKRIKEMKRKDIFYSGIFVNPRAIGFPILMDVKIKLKDIGENEREQLISFLQTHRRVIDLHSIMGDYDFTCVLIAKDSGDLENISNDIRMKFKSLILEWKGMLILKTYKIERYDLD